MAHLLYLPQGEGIPTILKGELERKEEKWREKAANQPLHTAPEQQPGVKIGRKKREEQKQKEKREMFS